MSASPTERLEVDVEDADGRYHRQSLISWWDQDRLAEAKILVVGAGALGNELLKNLALLGIGHVVVIDLDTVENSNLSRCVLFRETDEGRPKAHVVAEAARALNPDITITPVVGDVRTAFGLQVFADVDVVLGGLDNREARLHINGCCWKTSTPLVDGAIEGLMGMMRVFSPPDSACYECTMNDRDQELLAARRACSLLTREQMLEGKVPTTATSASIIAAMQVQEAVKLLHRDRIDAPFGGKGVAYNGLTHDSYVVTYPRREDCLSHDTYNLQSATPVAAAATFGELLDDGRARLGDGTVLDLELEIVTHLSCTACETEEAVFRPIDGLTQGAALCEVCGAERRLTLVHSVTSEDEALLTMTAEQIGLPPFDIVTARCDMARHHFLVGGDAFELEQLSRA